MISRRYCGMVPWRRFLPVGRRAMGEEGRGDEGPGGPVGYYTVFLVYLFRSPVFRRRSSSFRFLDAAQEQMGQASRSW
jgi:hypothetical protein